jgi:WD40 repeat protein
MDRSRITIRHMNILICLQKRMLWLFLLLLLFPRVESRAMQSVDIEFIPVITLDSKVDVHDIAWSSDGKYLATRDTEGRANVWESQSWTLVTSFLCEAWLPGHTQAFSWSPSNNSLAVGCSPAMADFASLPGYEDLTVMPIDTASQSVAWSMDGQSLAFTQPDKTITITDEYLQVITILGEDQEGLRPHTSNIAWSPSGQYLAVRTRAQGSSVTIWDIANRAILLVPDGGELDAFWISDTEVSLVMLGPNPGDRLQTWDVASKTMINELSLPYDGIEGIHHTNNLIVQCDDSDNLNFYDLETLQLVVPDEVIPCNRIKDLEWSSDGLLAIASSGEVDVWQVENLPSSES